MSEFTKVNDSGARQSFDTGSVRDLADGKGRFDLIPTYPLQRLAEHFENGAKKYGDRNWEKGQPLMRYLDSAFRHLVKGILAGDYSEDHFSALVWNIMAYEHTLNEIEHGRLPKELDNRPDRMKPAPKPEPTLFSTMPAPPPITIRYASEDKVANLCSGWVAFVSAWERGNCAWCGLNPRGTALYFCSVCEGLVPNLEVRSQVTAACAAGSTVLK